MYVLRHFTRALSKPLASVAISVIGLSALLGSLISPSVSREVATSATAMSNVDKLIAIEEIKQLNARYFRCLSQQDWDCWRALFAPEFVYEFEGPDGMQTRRGPEGMIQHIQENGLYDRVKSVFYGHIPEIEILSPTAARSVMAADYRLYYPLGQPYKTTGKEAVSPGKSMHVYVYYYETYVKHDGRWQLKSLPHSPIRIDDEGGVSIISVSDREHQ